MNKKLKFTTVTFNVDNPDKQLKAVFFKDKKSAETALDAFKYILSEHETITFAALLNTAMENCSVLEGYVDPCLLTKDMADYLEIITVIKNRCYMIPFPVAETIKEGEI